MYYWTQKNIGEEQAAFYPLFIFVLEIYMYIHCEFQFRDL
jgi:hypothetical protein